MLSRISPGTLVSVGTGQALRLDIIEEAKDLIDAEDEEVRLFRMVLGSVFPLIGITGGISDRTGGLEMTFTVSELSEFSSTGSKKIDAAPSLDLTSELPLISERMGCLKSLSGVNEASR